EARKKARKALTAVDDGRDPTAERATKRAVSGLLFSTVMEDYFQPKEPEMKPRSHEECCRHLRQHWKPLHKLAVTNISRALVASHLLEMGKGRWDVAADRALSTF